MFQFHKVRLKEIKGKRGEYTFDEVSIPQGTIKSATSLPPTALIPMFQFHKVRLKVSLMNEELIGEMFQFHKVRLKVTSISRCYNYWWFQFHKVRLKAGFSPAASRCLTVSIPQGTIKRSIP